MSRIGRSSVFFVVERLWRWFEFLFCAEHSLQPDLGVGCRLRYWSACLNTSDALGKLEELVQEWRWDRLSAVVPEAFSEAALAGELAVAP